MNYPHAAVAVLSGLLLAGCQEENEAAQTPPAATEHAAPAKNAAATTGQPEVVVYKNASCGCCKLWVEHMQNHGFPVKTVDVDDLGPVKERVGTPHGMGSCHTAEVGGYFIEGHVPAADVQRLLAEKPKAKGLAAPGMPIGSPGMEQGDRVEPYQVMLIREDGGAEVYASYPKPQ